MCFTVKGKEHMIYSYMWYDPTFSPKQCLYLCMYMLSLLICPTGCKNEWGGENRLKGYKGRKRQKNVSGEKLEPFILVGGEKLIF